MSLKMDPYLLTQGASEPNKAALTKTKIVEAAMRIVCGRGLDSLRFSEVAKDSGISASLILYHFATPEDLLLEMTRYVMRHAHEYVEALIDSRPRNQDPLEALVEANFEWSKQNPDFARFYTLIFHRAPLSRTLAPLHESMVSAGTNRILGYLSVRPTDRDRLVAETIHALFVGSIIRMLSLGAEAKAHLFARHVFEASKAIAKHCFKNK